MQSSTADLEAALLRAAAELRAAEAAAAESAGAADEQLPEFEGEESVEEAAAASNAADAAAQGADDASTAAKAAAAAGVAGEEGAEELLRELQEQQQREREQQEQQQRERQQRWEQQPAPSDSAGAAGAGAAGEGVAPAPSSAPLPPVHPRLSFYTLSSRWGGAGQKSCLASLQAMGQRDHAWVACYGIGGMTPLTCLDALPLMRRLELYVQQDTWENLDRWVHERNESLGVHVPQSPCLSRPCHTPPSGLVGCTAMF